MYKKHIEHLAIVSLKYFFDFDYNFITQVFIVTLVLLSLSKLFMNRITNVLYEGISTVKEDIVYFRDDLLTLKEDWDNSRAKDALINNLRTLKNLVPEKIS